MHCEKERFLLEWQSLSSECLLMNNISLVPAERTENPLLRTIRTFPYFGCHFLNNLVDVDNFVDNSLFGRICDPERTAAQKFILTLRITVDKVFDLHLMFEKFEFLADYSCYSEHVTFKGSFPNDPLMVFCGKRNPLEIFYTSNILNFFAVGGMTSTFQVFFHITSSQNFRSFHLCPDPCPDTNCCGVGNKLENLLVSLAGKELYFCLTNQIYTEGLGQINIINVKGPKYHILCLSKCLKNLVFAVHDGPGISSSQLRFGEGDLKLSTFQATLLVHSLHMQNNEQRNILFYSKQYSAAQKPKLLDLPLVLKFSARTSNPISLSVIWYLQPPDQSINIVEEVNYTGPEEPREFICYGGLSIYFIDWSGENEEILHLSHSFIRISSDRQRHRRKEYKIITKLDTKFVVAVHYFYTSQASLSAKLVLSPTYCVGHYVSFSPCVQVIQMVDKPLTGNYGLLQMRSTHKCAVISIFNNLLSVKNFTIHHIYQEFCSEFPLTHTLSVSFPAHRNYLKEI